MGFSAKEKTNSSTLLGIQSLGFIALNQELVRHNSSTYLDIQQFLHLKKAVECYSANILKRLSFSLSSDTYD